MKFIAAIVVIALSDVAICNQDDHATFVRTANMNSVRPQLDSSTYLKTFNSQQSQTFQMITSSQNDIISYGVIKRPSSFYIPKISFSACGQSSSVPYFSSRSSDQQYLSMCVPQGVRDFTSRSLQLMYSSISLPLNIQKSSSTHSLAQFPLFSSTSSRPLRSVSRTGRQLGRYTGGNAGIAGTTGGGLPVFRSSTNVEDSTNIEINEHEIVETYTPQILVSSSEVIYDHPPHIHNLDVECSKTTMTINIEFDRAFDGIIYSKGYYTNPECTYVKQNSGSARYSFTVNLDSCGTQFINDFESAAGQAYLENVLVLQNEPGIQEVWDAVRSVRCLWKGKINKTLMTNLAVNMLNQEIVTFSGDTVAAKLDIQIGKGPFAPVADGLVKIGETMTLVVSVEGDPDFDLQVRDCLARDEASTNILQLTNERGCIVKPKLFGAFQKTKDTGNTGASIIAYAFFQAFKFPDVMDLFIECNVELCKSNCEPCLEANQQIEPGRRRRSVTYAPRSNNSTNSVLLSDPVHVRQRFKVIMLDDLSPASNQILGSMEKTAIKAIIKEKEICMSSKRFYTTLFFMLSTLFVETISAVVLYVKLQQIRRSKVVG